MGDGLYDPDNNSGSAGVCSNSLSLQGKLEAAGNIVDCEALLAISNDDLGRVA